MRMGAWSMARVLRQRIEYYIYYTCIYVVVVVVVVSRIDVQRMEDCELSLEGIDDKEIDMVSVQKTLSHSESYYIKLH